MKLVYARTEQPWRGKGVAYNGPMEQAITNACNGNVVNLARFRQEREQRLRASEVPVFLLLNHDDALDTAWFCRQNGLPFVVIDHPHASEMRIHAKSDDWGSEKHKMVRIAANGIYAPFRYGAPILWNRRFDWKIEPWRTDLPRKILYCPSARDFYGRGWLGRDDTLEDAFMDELECLKIKGIIQPDWHGITRTRFENEWAKTHQSVRPGSKEAILACGATAEGNSGVHFDALRLGTPAFVWRHEGRPLANPLATYAPLTLDLLDYPAVWKIPREPFFEQLAMRAYLTINQVFEGVSRCRIG